MTKQSHKRRPGRELIAVAAERRIPRMHWHWCRRGLDILSLLERRFGLVLPNDDAGLDGAKLIAQHYLRLHVDGDRVARANLRLWAPWLGKSEVARLIKSARKAKTPSAAQLGRDWRVTTDEVAALGLTTITAITITQDGERTRQARRRRKAGAGTKRGRPRSDGPKPWQVAGASSKAAYYRNLMKTKKSETENSHASSYIRGMQRDEFRSHSAEPQRATAPLTPVIEVAEVELLPEIKITLPRAQDVIQLTAIPAAGRALARRPFRPGLLEQFREQGMAMFGGAR